MKKFFIHGIIFISINIFIATFYIWFTNNQYTYSNSQTGSALFIIPKNTKVDILIMGSSHAGIFADAGNHERVEKILNKKVVNVSKAAAGIVPEKLFLEYFFRHGNSTKEILYIIEPAIFYSSVWNESNFFLENEPLYADFFWLSLREGIDNDVLVNYLKSKFSLFWATWRKPLKNNIETYSLDAVSNEAIQKRLNFLYPDGQNEIVFDKYKVKLAEVIDIAKANNAKLTFIYPPTLLGDAPGSERLTQEISYYEARLFDFTNEIIDPSLYSDHDHLNTAGVVRFTTDYLVTIFSSNSSTISF